MTLIRNVVPTGLVGATLTPMNAFAEIKAATAKLTDTRKRVECLRRADNSDSHDADS